MQPKDSVKWLISVCGLNCAQCDIRQAYHGNEDLRDKIIDWVRKEHNESVKPAQIRCDGCRASLDIHWSPDCRIMLCARKKEIRYCFQCEDFPCPILDKFSSDGVSHHERTVRNLKRMKEIGIEAWLDEQKRRNQCVFCP